MLRILVDLSTSIGYTEEIIRKIQGQVDQQKIRKSFKVGDIIWLQLNKERLQGLGKKYKAQLCGIFEILEKVGDDTYQLILPAYTHIYLV